MDSLNLRIIHTHDVEENWKKCTDFIPVAGEVIVYDIDNNYSYERFKIGDGNTKVNELPFTVDNIIEKIFNVQDQVIYADAGRITKYKKEDPVT